MPELWDLYDIDRRPLNRTIQRGEALPEGMLRYRRWRQR